MILLLIPTTYREGLARGVRATVLRPMLALQEGAADRSALVDDPVRLRAERDSLAAFLVENSSLLSENRTLREILGLRDRLPRSFVPAEIVRTPGRGDEGFFQLTAGSNDGVLPGASIVAAQGLVGRVREIDNGIAFGIDWMHPEFRASAMTVDGEIYGIVEPRREGLEPLLALTGTPRHINLAEGELIVTSGHGGVFPRGIPIGTVLGAEGGEAEWQRNYLIQPLVSPAEMAYVLVLGDPERSLEGQDLALAWGIRPEEPRDRELAADSAQGFNAPVSSTNPGAAGTPAQPSGPVTGQPAPAGPAINGGGANTPSTAQPEPEPAAPAPAPSGGPSLLGTPVDQR